jgi:GGDEF domain-containing protein
VLALAGEHLVASVNVTSGEPTGEIERETRRNENGRPIRTIVKLGACVVDCTWQPEVEAGPDTTGIVEGLCTAVVCSLAGVAGARAQRDVVTQLGDRRALARHLALRQRLGEPAALVLITVDGESAIRHRELYGRLAWSASLAQSASVLERIARVHGGQAYQTAERELRLLVDAEEAEAACRLAEEALAEDEDLVFRVGIAQQR